MIPFVKMHGIGNDFVLLDGIGSDLPDLDFIELSRSVNDRRSGIGGDGLILLERGKEAPFRMRMFNPDGSESEMCGNGIRCFARLLQARGYAGVGEVDVETGAGILTVKVEPSGWVRVDMGKARLARADIPMNGDPESTFIEEEIDGFHGTAVSMGNPHLVMFVPDVEAIALEDLGPKFERHALFPRRVNVHFAAVIDHSHLRMRTWERGAGVTLACGTGACAVAAAGVLTGRSNRSVDVRLPGGHLQVEYTEEGQVFMTGPAETVFVGEWSTQS